ncbi:hypothetical protein MWN33_05735 [Starkeya koreensis]|uniref:Uncharacterized protein n=1 Tax=Ancylobacter koreensis TaxID=266121 RepID=A0ABT0DJR8_9HYPH|nr:hypothetical protein [Ancylobacter koreensis]MCK0207532.1 hypothetical protein [Ancylobacter koreensis]
MGTHVRERESYIPEYVMVEQYRIRQRAEAAIEGLLALLDELEDPDLEPDNDDEPTMGWCEGAAGYGLCPTLADECEDGGDAEHSLGWREQMAGRGQCHTHVDDGEDDDPREYTALETRGRGFFRSGPDDAEDANDAGWDTADSEPSLGAPEADSLTLSQIGWARGAGDDLESGVI